MALREPLVLSFKNDDGHNLNNAERLSLNNAKHDIGQWIATYTNAVATHDATQTTDSSRVATKAPVAMSSLASVIKQKT
eukprot:scaffold402806_cov28-Prasinocladus_malaysianus.AAC.1